MTAKSFVMGINRAIALMQDMAVFVAVVEAGSFTSAAKKLGATTSSVSRQVSRLEDCLHVKLLERTTRNLRLNAAGERVFAQCRITLDSARDVLDVADQICGEPQGRLKIGVPKAYGSQVLKTIIPSFLNTYSSVEVQLLVTDRTMDPFYDDVDILVTITDKPIESLVAVCLGEVRSVLCASESYIAKRGHPVHPSELTDHDCLSLGESALDNVWSFAKGHETASVTTSGRYIANHTEIRKDAVLNGFGVGLFPDFSVTDEIETGVMIQILADWSIVGKYQGKVNLQYPQSRYISPLVRAFVNFAKGSLGAGAVDQP